jgi:ribonuclease I (enterobacter ribonuclease)
MKVAVFLCVLLAALVPHAHGDFGHYTFALTWQPGICSTGDGCLADQPRAPLVGLHGLWASRPQALIQAGVPNARWWSKGCDLYHTSDAPPPISAALRARLLAVMPHFPHSLLTHEYDKHVQCFGFDPTQFFSTELVMRNAVAAGPFGSYLVHEAGQTVAHAALTRAFTVAFATNQATSLQLQCDRDGAGREVLTQIWITVRANELAVFPRAASLMDATTNQDTCPASFVIPAWPAR